MQSTAWVTLFRHLPPAWLDGLMVKTLNGTELTVQTILRIDHEFVVFKGRLAGTQDTGRVFFIPFAQIDHLGHQKEIKEAEFSAMFDTLAMPPASRANAPMPAGLVGNTVVTMPQPADVARTETAPLPAEAAPNLTTAPAARSAPLPLKSAVLERFRTRSGGGSNPGVRPPQG